MSQAYHAHRTKKTFGLTPEEYEELLQRQGGVCAICLQRPVSKRLAVDHDHQTGAVRGLLCSRCNHDLLGALHDSLEMALRVVGYLGHPPARRGPLGRCESCEMRPATTVTIAMEEPFAVCEGCT